MKKVVIIGAGPAGLAAGYSLCSHSVLSLILEKDIQVGGLSRTIEYKGYFFDIGPHRFYTHNRVVFKWWSDLLKEDFIKKTRHSRIYYRKKFFHYPLSIKNVIGNLGVFSAVPILFSYLKSRLFPYPEENNFQQWVTNRFGKKLYQIFFKHYTEKVWGIPCERISADWAGQRIKNLSLSVALRNALSRGKKRTPTTLINEFYYPRLGAGMMYAAAAKKIVEKGSEIKLQCEVVEVRHNHKKVTSVIARDVRTGRDFEIEGTDFCSSMPINSLISQLYPSPDRHILETCKRLSYRSLVIVNLIVNRNDLFKDNWVYIHAPELRVARLQNYNNWSLSMLLDYNKTSLGMEYFCTEGDALWSEDDEALKALAMSELKQLGLVCPSDVQDGFVLRVPQAYPIYETNYRQALEEIKKFINGFSNLQCMGRNGMFYYNSMDHHILTGFAVAKNILGGDEDVWDLFRDHPCYEEPVEINQPCSA